VLSILSRELKYIVSSIRTRQRAHAFPLVDTLILYHIFLIISTGKLSFGIHTITKGNGYLLLLPFRKSPEFAPNTGI
jgi:hypothetical protein